MIKLIISCLVFVLPALSAAQPADSLVIPPGMVLVSEGEFMMGIPDDSLEALVELGKKVPHMSIGHAEGWFGDERPAHRVAVKAFLLDKFEVRNQQFAKFISESGYRPEGHWKKYATPDRMHHPVVAVTWNDAAAFAKWAGKRLPTEAEWEYTAKGGTTFKWFPWGEKPDATKAQWRHQGESFWDGMVRLVAGREIDTRPVGSYPANGFGLFDMCGNVREWCADDYQAYPGLQDSQWQHTEYRPFADPAALQNIKIARGGNWDSPNPVFIRLTRRLHFDKSMVSYTQGFRCAKSL